MGKNVRLVNIYIKIHNKKQLTFDDMEFLSKYDRECFEKTCQNVFYKMPEVKPVLQKPEEQKEDEAAKPAILEVDTPDQRSYDLKDQVEMVLARLQKLERDELMVQDVDAAKVRNLIGNLYMELLFPHSDSKEQYFNVQDEESFLNIKA